ncbi:SRPBCC family protein [Allorhizocola rhizosphaerae]|uniref:SRPBCC family protein n=1 Tax=Allorhizocola rhizosphaerae TaxID=1872709 RepID=UPI000E3C4A9B|nr:SRPBCC family protein [Allorhizocola rhizosphaerae]
MAFRISLDIERPPEAVFAYIADARHMPQWYEAVQSVTATSPTRFRMLRSLPGGQAENEVEVTGYRTDEEITFASISGPTPFEYRYRLERIPAGTRLTLDGEISAEGLRGPAAHLGGLAGQLFKQGMKKNLKALKQVLESAQRREAERGL